MSLENKEPHDPYAALRNQDFRLLLTGRFITSFANEMLSFAIGWELWLRTHQALVLGMVGLVQVIPVILLSLPAGHVADQYNRKRIVLITELFLALCVLGLGWLSYTEGPLVLIYALLRRCCLKPFPPSSFRTQRHGAHPPGSSPLLPDPRLPDF